MITTREMYKDYIADLDNKISVINEELKEAKRNRDNVYSILEKHKEWINNNTNINFKEVNESSFRGGVEKVTHIKLKSFQISSRNGGTRGNYATPSFDGKAFNLYINSYAKYCVSINKLNRKLEALQKEHIPYQLYAAILRSLNNEVVDSIIQGNSISLGSNIGSLSIVEKKRHYNADDKYNHKVIDWGESNKLKAKIIADGGIPFRVQRDENGKNIGNNGGTKYLVYRTDPYSYWWHWGKYFCKVANRSLFSFVPTAFNNTGQKIDELKETTEVKDIKHLALGSIEKLNLYLGISPHNYLTYRDDI